MTARATLRVLRDQSRRLRQSQVANPVIRRHRGVPARLKEAAGLLTRHLQGVQVQRTVLQRALPGLTTLLQSPVKDIAAPAATKADHGPVHRTPERAATQAAAPDHRSAQGLLLRTTVLEMWAAVPDPGTM